MFARLAPRFVCCPGMDLEQRVVRACFQWSGLARQHFLDRLRSDCCRHISISLLRSPITCGSL